MAVTAGFENPAVLLGLLCVPALYALYRRVLSGRRAAAMSFSSLSLVRSALGGRSSRRGGALFALSLGAASLLVVGLAGPHLPLEQSREGVNVVLVIDVSGSMQVSDYPPSRLEAAKASARILLDSLEPRDHAGIVTFESGATTAAFLSPHKDRVADLLAGIAPREGQTAIGDGLSLGVEMATSIPNKKKVVILLSDGVSNAGVISPAEAVAFARANSIQVHAVGLGSDGDAVLGYDVFGRPQYAELDEETLQAIATQTGGRYFKSVDARTLNEIYAEIGGEIEREVEETDVSRWLFAAALAVFGVQMYARYGRGRVIQ